MWQNDRVEIIANDQGNRTTPSYVAFTESERLIGDSAKNQAAMNPRQTVFDAKRLIGRRFDDAEVKKDMAHWPFKVVDKEGSPFIEVRPRSAVDSQEDTWLTRVPVRRSSTSRRPRLSRPPRSPPWFSRSSVRLLRPSSARP